MNETRMIEVKREIFAENVREADVFRAARKAESTFAMDIMGSPGAGKTSLLIALIERLKNTATMSHEDTTLFQEIMCQDSFLKVGVIEADLESDVDALKMKEAGIASVELNTKGVCHVEMGMVEKAFAAFGNKTYDYLFLENIGNLVCPAEFDTGCHARVMLLSVPEGYDKVYKYPPMFAVVDALIVTKCDYLSLNPDFDMPALKEAATALNPTLRVFVVSARTGEGMDELAEWVKGQRDKALA